MVKAKILALGLLRFSGRVLPALLAIREARRERAPLIHAL